MAKQLNSKTGKGWFVAQGQCAIEAMLNDGTTQAELAEHAKLFKNGNIPNAGAVSNILKGLGWGPFNGQAPVVTEKKASSALCPGRVEGFVSAFAESDTVTPADVESIILADGVKWNQLVLKLDERELAMLGKFLKAGGYSPCPRVSLRVDFERAEQDRLAQVDQSVADAISALNDIDAELAADTAVLKAIRAYYAR